MASSKPIILAITLGDINGIGPEVALKAAYTHRWPTGTHLVLVGNTSILHEQARALNLPLPPAWDPHAASLPRRKVVSWDPYPSTHLSWAPGKIHAKASKQAISWIRETVLGCMNGHFSGMITAPICKEGLKKAGLNMPGHTEFIAEITKTKRFAMMLMGGGLRVILVTRHIPLRSVPESITSSNILETIEITSEALPWLGCRKGTIGVCGLNPHAGDGGAIGTEDKTIIAPAIRTAKRRRIRVEGPVPPDAIFYQAIHGTFDAVIAMYHDQGLGPLKMLAFDQGINITLGLPIIRTSPDHGTAFNIAGQNKARSESIIEAVRLARTLCQRKNPWLIH